MTLLVLTFLLAFILHEIEEIIYVSPWITRHKTDLRLQNQQWMKGFGASGVSRHVFALLVLEEFVVFGILITVAIVYDWREMLAGLFIVYLLHLVGHAADMFYRQRYIPGAPTALITIPIVVWIVWQILSQGAVAWVQVAGWALGLGLVLMLNLMWLRKVSAVLAVR